MKTLEIRIPESRVDYEIFIGNGLFGQIGRLIAENFEYRKTAIITDNNLYRLYVQDLQNTLNKIGIESRIISVQPGEKSKSIETLMTVLEQLCESGITRGDLIIAFGGGVVGDLGGFAASIFLRGVPYIQIPTSLLAQVDSSVGGKTAIDLPWGKNLIGSFYHPKAVFIDPVLLQTLEKRHINDGLAEIIKYGCIKEKAILDRLMDCKHGSRLPEDMEELIYSCCEIKRRVVEADERDKGERMLLNFGHTLGHAVEKYFGYEKYTHGEAVAIGMAEVTRKSEAMGFTEEGTADVITEILKKFGLPHEMPVVNKDDIMDIVRLDKKFIGSSISLILLRRIGCGEIIKLSHEELINFL
jgi:3-dehydroquinate synthase